MKVGTDGVLLGAWVSLRGDESSALDVGTGTGLIALMLAQRTDPAIRKSNQTSTPGTAPVELPVIQAIDIDPAAADEAAANFAASPWADRLTARAVSLQNFRSEWEQNRSDLFPKQTSDSKTETLSPVSVPISVTSGENQNTRLFDLIVSNPPFFKASLKAPDAQRSAARHDDTLPPAELIAAAVRLLSPRGRLAVIYPPEEARAFILEAEAAGLYLSRQTRVISVAGQAPKRHLMEFTRTASIPTFDDLVLHDNPVVPPTAAHGPLTLGRGVDTSGHQPLPRSAAYRALTAEFYLD